MSVFTPILIVRARGFSSIIEPCVWAVPVWIVCAAPTLYSLSTLTLELSLSTFNTNNSSVEIPITSFVLRRLTSPLIGRKVTIPVVPVLPIPVDTLNIEVFTPIV